MVLEDVIAKSGGEKNLVNTTQKRINVGKNLEERTFANTRSKDTDANIVEEKEFVNTNEKGPNAKIVGGQAFANISG